MELDCLSPLPRIVVQPTSPSIPASGLERLRHIAAIANQGDESSAGKHPGQLGQDLDVDRCLIAPTCLCFGLHMPSINDLSQIAHLRLHELTHRVTNLLRVDLHIGPSVVASYD